MKAFFLFFLSLFLLLPKVTLAHELKTSGSIGAVFHLEPNHDPVAGEPAIFFFEFKDKQNKFDPKNCECVLKILQRDGEIFSQDLFKDNPAPSLTNSSLSYTFPARNIYKVKVEGKAKDGSFSDFSLEYDIRVAKISEALLDSQVQASSGKPQEKLSSLYLLLLPVAAVFGIIFLKKKK